MRKKETEEELVKPFNQLTRAELFDVKEELLGRAMVRWHPYIGEKDPDEWKVNLGNRIRYYLERWINDDVLRVYYNETRVGGQRFASDGTYLKLAKPFWDCDSQINKLIELLDMGPYWGDDGRKIADLLTNRVEYQYSVDNLHEVWRIATDLCTAKSKVAGQLLLEAIASREINLKDAENLQHIEAFIDVFDAFRRLPKTGSLEGLDDKVLLGKLITNTLPVAELIEAYGKAGAYSDAGRVSLEGIAEFSTKLALLAKWDNLHKLHRVSEQLLPAIIEALKAKAEEKEKKREYMVGQETERANTAA